jgi:hypothetical protein
MSNIDIVVISQEDFHAQRSSTDAISTPSAILASILDHDCFNEQKCIEVYNSQFKQKTFIRANTTHNTRSIHNQQSQRGYRTTRTFQGDKTEKEIMACLNILNKSNKHIVYKKVARIFQLNGEPGNLIRFVLEKAVSNTPYMYLIMDIIDNLPCIPQTICVEVKKTFSDEFVNNIVCRFSELASIDYDHVDGFCVFNKLKTLILNTHNGVLYMHTVEQSEYFHIITSLFDQFKQKHIIDLIVTLICILIDTLNNQVMVNKFKELCNKPEFIDSCSTKTRFTLERFKEAVVF